MKQLNSRIKSTVRFGWLSCFLVLSFVLFPCTLAYASENNNVKAVASSQTLLAKMPQLREKAIRRGSVPVILRLAADYQNEAQYENRSEVAQQRQRIVDTQSRVLTHLEQYSRGRVKRFKYSPYLALRISERGLDRLLISNDVVDIFEDKALPPRLESSTAVIGAPAARAPFLTGIGQAVAILDTGIDTAHAYFNTGGSRIVSEACYSTTDLADNLTSVCPGGASSSTAAGSGINCDATIDGCDHGTHVAGIAAGNDGSANVGVATGASIISIQIFSRADDDPAPGGNRPCGTFNLPSPCSLTLRSDQILGLERVYELRNDFDIAAVNMSLGGATIYTATCNSDPRADIVADLRAAEIFTIIATGNGSSINGISAPACVPLAIRLGATNDDDEVADFSNVASFMTFFAPGVDIVSSVPGGGTLSLDGTSMATPHVTGTMALMRQRHGDVSSYHIVQALQETGTLIDDTRTGGTVTDIPRINADRAVLGTWVQQNYSGTETGWISTPYNTVTEGAASVLSDGHLLIRSGTYTEAPTFDRPMMVHAIDGSVILQ